MDRFGTIPIFRDDSRLDTETYKMAEPRSNTNLSLVLESTLICSHIIRKGKTYLHTYPYINIYTYMYIYKYKYIYNLYLYIAFLTPGET